MAGSKSRNKTTKKATKAKASQSNVSVSSNASAKGSKAANSQKPKSKRGVVPEPASDKPAVATSMKPSTETSVPNETGGPQYDQVNSASRPKRYASRNVRLYIAADAEDDPSDESGNDTKPSEDENARAPADETNTVDMSEEENDNMSDLSQDEVTASDVGGGFFDFEAEEDTNMEQSSDMAETDMEGDDTPVVPSTDTRQSAGASTKYRASKMSNEGKGPKAKRGGASELGDTDSDEEAVLVPRTASPLKPSPRKMNKNTRSLQALAKTRPVTLGSPIEDAGSNVFLDSSVDVDDQSFVNQVTGNRAREASAEVFAGSEDNEDDGDHKHNDSNSDERGTFSNDFHADESGQGTDSDRDDDMTLPVTAVRAKLSRVQPTRSSIKSIPEADNVMPRETLKSGRRERPADSKNRDGNSGKVTSPRVASTKRDKGKGKVVVETIDHKIVVPATFPSDVPTTPVSVKKRTGGSFAGATTDNLSTSPKKKVKISKGKSKAVAEPLFDNVLDTPVTGVSRYLAASQIGDGNEDGSNVGPSMIKDAVSDPTNVNHSCHMCSDMRPTYEGALAPPAIRSAKKIIMQGPSTDKPFIKFKSAMARVGVTEESPLFLRLRNLVIQACFGPSLYNPARVDPGKIVYTAIPSKGYTRPRYNYSLNLSGSPAYRADTAIAFVMFGTVVESNVANSVVQTYGKHRRSICIKTFTTEFLRAVNIFATLWGIEQPYGVEVNKEGGGLTFLTLPTVTPYGPRWAMPVDNVSGSEDDLPETSVGGVAVANPTGILSREDLQKLIRKGTIFNEKLPIHDFTNTLKRQDVSPLDQELLEGAEAWTGGEIPAGSFVCIHYVPGPFKRGKKEEAADVEVQFNVLRVVVLATAAK